MTRSLPHVGKCGLTGHNKSGCPTKINSARSSKVYTDSSDEEAERNKKEREKELRKKAKEKCGKCPICKERHTFTRNRDGKEWPSDRFISCAKFQKMTPKDRALQLEKSSECSRCTAWTHKKADCRVPPGYKCGLDRNGSKCQSDHSRLVCGSGVAYCSNVRISATSDSLSTSSQSSVSLSTSSQTSDSFETDDSTFPDVDAETLFVFQDFPPVLIMAATGV